jgi:hypothetical protein
MISFRLDLLSIRLLSYTFLVTVKIIAMPIKYYNQRNTLTEDTVQNSVIYSLDFK